MHEPSLRDYAIIGDCRSAALISSSGSVDWLCWPRFDSPSCFAALLDRERGGHWRIAPSHPFRSQRTYVPESNVLETTFETQSGALRVRDAMSIASEEDEAKLFLPEHEIVRFAECLAGEVEVDIAFEPRPGYGAEPFRLRERGKLGFWVEMGSKSLVLRSDAALQARGRGVSGRHVLRQGSGLSFSLSFTSTAPAELPPLSEVKRSIERSTRWWKSWACKLKYDGPYRRAILRSALVLKLLTYGPSGAVVAAPTTSLPERIGGALNWDYRYCWLRDAAFTVRAMFALGFEDEASAFVGWLLHTTRLTRPQLRILYDVFGNSPKRERTLPHLRGYASSRPIRTGNAAQYQLQLDVYGEVIEAAVHFIRAGGSFDSETAAFLRDLGLFVCKHWRDPDQGIWEPREAPVPHTHSHLLCWVALRGLLELDWRGHLRGRAPVELFQRTQNEIRAEIASTCWNERIQSYVKTPGGEDVDASLLALALYGFEPASSARIRKTFECIRRVLGANHWLFYRNRALAAQGDGAFGLCSFWASHYLAMGGGTLDEAREAFETTLGFANDVGLFAEEINPDTGDPLGNFPQGFTHFGLINAALSLQQREQGAVQGDDRPSRGVDMQVPP